MKRMSVLFTAAPEHFSHRSPRRDLVLRQFQAAALSASDDIHRGIEELATQIIATAGRRARG